jgi:hypothetical protein
MNTNYVFKKYGKKISTKLCAFAQYCVNVLAHALQIAFSAVKVGFSGSG